MNTMEIQKIVIIYLVITNVVTFFMFGINKVKAKKSKWRKERLHYWAWLYLVEASELGQE